MSASRNSPGEKRPRSPNDNLSATSANATSATIEAPTTTPTSILSSHASPEAFEKAHVHTVYDVIAPHFSATRYKPWPRVKAFVETCVAEAASRTLTIGGGDLSTDTGKQLPYGILVADVGCGNGKNLCIHNLSHAFGVGCDRSLELMKAASLGARRTRKVELVPMEEKAKTATADEGLLEVVTTAENPKGKKKKMQLKVSTDVVVPEALQRGLENVGSDGISTGFRSKAFDIVLSIAVVHHFSTFERRVAAVRELLRICVPVTGRVLIYAWAKEQAKDRGEGVDVFIPWALHGKFAERQQQATEGEDASPRPPAVLQRYYHLFIKGELEEVCLAVNSSSTAGGEEEIMCHIEDSYYDQENWCVVLSRK